METLGIDARFFSPLQTGIGRHVYELISGLKHQYRLVVFVRPNMVDHPSLQDPMITICPVSYAHYSWKEQILFPRLIGRYALDLMIFPHFNVPLAYRGKYIVTIHDLTLHFFPGKKKTDIISRYIYTQVIRQAVARATHCMTVSNNTKQDMIRYLPVQESRITVAYNGVCDVFFEQSSQPTLDTVLHSYGLSFQKYFLYCGVLRSHKNIERLLDAYEQFYQESGGNCPMLVLTGPKDKTYNHIYDRIVSSLPSVQVLGLVPDDDLSVLMQGSLAFVFPSLYEGFGMPPLEAMAKQTLVLCSRASCLPEIAKDAPVYFDPYSVEEIYKALCFACETQGTNTRVEYIKKGLEVSREYRWETMVSQYISVIESVCK